MAGFGDLMGMMRDLGSLKAKIAEMQEQLGHKTVDGEAGGGMVTATVNGRMELVGLRIEPEVADPDDVELLEDLVKAAVGQAMSAAQDLQRQEMQKLLGGLPLPPGMDALLG